MSYEEVIETQGNLRVKLVLDECPSEPENDGGCPVIRLDTDSTDPARIEHTGYGKFYDAGFDPVETLRYLNHRFYWREAIEVFERYVRIFHEGSVAEFNLGTWRENGYIAFTTRTLARAWGIPDDQPVPQAELTEWQAYVEGDVYGWVIERRVVQHTTVKTVEGVTLREVEYEDWDEVDSCWGYYGTDYAEETAREVLQSHTNYAASR